MVIILEAQSHQVECQHNAMEGVNPAAIHLISTLVSCIEFDQDAQLMYGFVKVLSYFSARFTFIDKSLNRIKCNI